MKSTFGVVQMSSNTLLDKSTIALLGLSGGTPNHYPTPKSLTTSYEPLTMQTRLTGAPADNEIIINLYHCVNVNLVAAESRMTANAKVNPHKQTKCMLWKYSAKQIHDIKVLFQPQMFLFK